jgi:hypothetical protein
MCRPAVPQGRTSRAIPDQVTIGTGPGIPARIKGGFCLRNVGDDNVEGQMYVDRPSKSGRGKPARSRKSNDLSESMRARIGASRCVGPHVLSGNGCYCFFEHLLYCQLPWLPLETGVPGSNVLNDKAYPARG